MTLLIFLIVLSILIFVHELGHFLVAKKAGIKIEEFGLGFPPRLFGKKIGETVYSINAFPIGGFVRLYGEDNPQSQDQERTFFAKGKFVRASVTAAGVVMNLLFALIAFSLIVFFLGVPKEVGKVKIIGIAEDSPAQRAQLEKNDIVAKVDGRAISSTKEFVELINLKKGQETILVVKRSNLPTFQVQIFPRPDPPKDEGALGVVVTSSDMVKPPLHQRPFIAVSEGAKETWFWAKTTILGIANTIYGALQGQVPKDIAGPIGIFQITSSVARTGILSIISFMGILSVNLAVLNILPFPALDGGRLFFIVIETITGRRVKPALERVAHTVGMVILLLLLLLVTAHDINRIFSSGFSFFTTAE